jgi:phage gp29-like protein
MAKKTLIKKPGGGNTIITQLIIKQPQRSTSDVSAWRNALRSADGGRVKTLFDLYDDLLIDTTLFRSWNKRIEAITNAGLVFQLEDNESNEEVDALMESLSWETLLTGIMNYKGYGRFGVECDFSDGFNASIIPPKHINLANHCILINDSDEKGIDYLTDPNLIVLGSPRDFGLFLRTAPYAIWKRGGFGDYAQWLELFGMPQRVGKYSSYDPQSRILLEQALQNAGSAPWCVIPKETDVETIDKGSNSSGNSFNEFRQACNEEMLIAVVGNTLTMIAGTKGARSLGDVHKEVEQAINKADMRFVEKVLNTCFKPMLEARGYHVQGGKFVFPAAVEPLTVTEIISLSDILDIPTGWLYDKFGIPFPKDGEPLARKKSVSVEEIDVDKKEKSPAKDKKKEEEKVKDTKLHDDRNFLLKLADKVFLDAPTKWSGALQNWSRSWKRRITGRITLDDGYTIDIDKLLKEAIEEVYGNKGSKELVNKNLFDITNNALQHGIDSELEDNVTDKEFIRQFKENAAVFSAFKNHQQTDLFVKALYDDDGKLRSFRAFRKECLKTGEKFNEQYLQTEYNTAVRAARMAANLKKYEKTAHLYPNLEYMETNSSHPREQHLEYVGTILPIHHKAWAWLMPPSDWNCDCSVRPTDKEPTAVPVKPSGLNPIFDNNPAQTAEFVNIKETPYYKHTPEKSRTEVIKEAKQYQADYLKQEEWRKNVKETYQGKNGGYLEIVQQPKQEFDKNKTTYKIMADNGGKYILLKPGKVIDVKNPDAFNFQTGRYSDAKHPETDNGYNAIYNSIHSANKQKVGEVIIRCEKEYSSRSLYEAIRDSFVPGRRKSIEVVILIRKGRKPIFLNVEDIRKYFNP